ncbi:hypothetical protein SAMN05421810_106349 [Amycolatopsis arida]|uniref:TIGR01777 family protein n=1 Tax=Amycolatopsis arida TaxID=587909 RepID=A0A1I5Y084_9PSEU|nr:TIGR01777 family oxidoreductase [Amycolatopsis arida]TDX97170.1 hypothetical protein CLV69_102273 [Amycolatopsis arida]SFQ37613.1 hypothetical protein SAMN05421810_106349 [Amycolatopsis arida]
MRVLIAGSSGLLGTALRRRLRAEGHEVRRLVRRPAAAPDEHGWDPPAGRVNDAAFAGVDAVVNFCGAPLAGGRWSAARKQVLLDSRVEPTEVLADAVAEHGIPVLVNGSGINFYGDTGSTVVDESAPVGRGFLAELCAAWEGATAAATRAGARVVLLRTAPVLAPEGGLLGLLTPLFRLGLAGRLGSGAQYFPWISLTDHVAAVRLALDSDQLRGPVNLIAPEQVTNAEFTRALAAALHRPAPWWVPAPMLRLVFGAGADEMLLTGPRAVPGALRRAGFAFAHPDLRAALSAVV